MVKICADLAEEALAAFQLWAVPDVNSADTTYMSALAGWPS